MELAVKTFLVAWFIIHFEPIELLVRQLPTWLTDILLCFKCLSFWMVFFITFDFYYAIAGSIIATIYMRYVDN